MNKPLRCFACRVLLNQVYWLVGTTRLCTECADRIAERDNAPSMKKVGN